MEDSMEAQNGFIMDRCARMAKLADAADLKSAGAYPPWGFKSPSGHQKIKDLFENCLSDFERQFSFGGCSDGCWF
jgi:hypothetical protein